MKWLLIEVGSTTSTVDRREPMIEIIGWNKKCVQNALKLRRQAEETRNFTEKEISPG